MSRTRRHLTLQESRRFEGITGKVHCLAVSPDGRHALSGSGRLDTRVWKMVDCTLRLWDVGTGEEIRRFDGRGKAAQSVGDSAATAHYHKDNSGNPTGEVRGACFSPDGRLALSGNDDGTMRLWDVDNGRELRRFHPTNREVNCVAFSPDGRLAACGGYSYIVWPGGGELPPNLRVYEAHTGREQYALSVHMMVYTVAFSPDGRFLLTAGDDKEPRLADARTGKEVRRFTGHRQRGCVAAFSPDGERILSGGVDGTLRLWNAASGEEVCCLEGHTSAITCVAVSPDGRRALSGSKDKTLRYWDLAAGKELACVQGHKGRVTSVAFLPDGRQALSGGWDRTVRLWALP